MRFAAIMLLTSAVPAAGQAPAAASDTAELAPIARQIVEASGADSGSLVVISAGRPSLDLAEAVAIEFVRRGVFPRIELAASRVYTSLWRDFPLGALDSAITRVLAEYAATLREADAVVHLASAEAPAEEYEAMMSDTARLARMTGAFARQQAAVDSMQNASDVVFVTASYPPGPAELEVVGMPADEYRAMLRAALGADYAEMRRTGAAIARVLERGRQLRITTPAGTDLTVDLARRPASVNAGAVADGADRRLARTRWVSLPGGTVQVAPREGTASGRVVVARDECAWKPVTDLRLTLRAGEVHDLTAREGGDCVPNLLLSDGPAQLGAVLVGLNPELVAVEDGPLPYRPAAKRGHVAIGIGNNADLGGTLSVPYFHMLVLADATLTVDGTTIVHDGELVVPPTEASR